MTRREANEKMIMIANIEQNGRGNLTTQRALPATVGTPNDYDTQWPVVKFENGDEALCPPLPFTVVNVFGKPEATRDQASYSCRMHTEYIYLLARHESIRSLF
ncbi:hypothetical protein DL93DRAFT_224074 [Clavulina sp. PMI_390]|nr:hypothetical protein DL93DRAFT_224074 [Clavulina sp. PMI_390]